MEEKQNPIKCFFGGMAVIPLGIITYYLLYALGIIEEIGREIFKIEPIITVTQAALILALLSFLATFITSYVDPLCGILIIFGIIFMATLFAWANVLELLKITLGDIIITILAAFLAIGLKAYITRSEAEYFY